MSTNANINLTIQNREPASATMYQACRPPRSGTYNGRYRLGRRVNRSKQPGYCWEHGICRELNTQERQKWSAWLPRLLTMRDFSLGMDGVG
ncbi:hypothetical protein Agabi119p4_8622 [Agaricus bisporus var. burnettii]|uniref:Uncharacterized protein n=1 Tax=Agaricus bisporus var. burnettii TaxID=192524 RepID=A0A8H7EYP2_AGABI|nr:hypothetical protein Agabi119p4_8622 [Agaricus bisporus var. burnettii]